MKNGMGRGGSYGHSTGGLNLGAQHFNNRYMTDISEATKSRTGTRRIIARSDHQQMITSNLGILPPTTPVSTIRHSNRSRWGSSERGIRLSPSSGLRETSRVGISNHTRLQAYLRFTRNNDCDHVHSNSLFVNHVPPLHLISLFKFASQQRPSKPHTRYGLSH